MVIYINIDGLTTRRKQLEENLHYSKQYCEFIKSNCLITGQLETMKSRLHLIRNTEAILQELIPYNAEQRMKRGVLNFVGKINKILFRTLDSDDGKRIYSKINALGNSTLKLAELADERIYIIQSGFNKTLELITDVQEFMTQEVKRVDTTLVKITRETLALEYHKIASRYVAQITEYLIELVLDTNILIGAILFVKSGQVHPKILTTEQTLASAQTIQESLTQTEFPLPLEIKYMSNVIALSDLTILYTDEKFIYICKIPLLDVEQYRLYENLPVPVRQGTIENSTRFAFIKPTTHYSAVSENYEHYINLQNLDKCKIALSLIYMRTGQPNSASRQLCRMRNPITSKPKIPRSQNM